MFNNRVLCTGKQVKWDANAWYDWWTVAKKKKATKQALIQLAQDEKEYGAQSKAYVCLHDDDDQKEDAFDGLDYEDAHLEFDLEKSPKPHI